MADMRLVVAGAGGRMGRTLVKAIADSKGFALAGALEDARSPLIGWDAGTLAGTPREWRQAHRRRRAAAGQGRRHHRLHRAGGDASPSPRSPPRPARCTSSAPPACRAADEAKIKDAAKSAVIVQVRQYEPRRQSAGGADAGAWRRRSTSSFDIEILEMHHNQKVDAPSGTALLLGARGGGGPRHRSRRTFGARAATATPARASPATSALPRCAAAAWSASTRVIFAGPAERIELTHKAEDRMIFARGALHAALWARGQKPGLYSMIDVLGLKDF